MKNFNTSRKISLVDFNVTRNIYIENLLKDDFQYFTSNDFILKDETIVKDYYSLLANIIGDTLVIKYSVEEKEIYITSSISYKGCYYLVTDESIFLFEEENNAYKYVLNNYSFNINENELISSLISHQLCLHSPYGSFEKKINYLPSGIELYLDTQQKIFLNLILLDIFKRINLCSNANQLVDDLKKIVKAYKYLSKNNLELHFSGGIDSTLLWKCFSEINQSIDIYNFAYPSSTISNSEKEITPESKMVSSVANKLNIKFKKIPYFDNFNLNIIFSSCQLSSRALISITQIRMPYDFHNVNKKSKEFSFLVNGQNADTLHSLNTYAPSTEVLFPIRQIFNIISIYRRFKFNYLFIKLFNLFPKNEKLLIALTDLDSLKEHASSQKNYLLDLDIEYKNKFFEERRYLFNINNFVSLSSRNKLNNLNKEYFLKIIRHFRTIQNSIRNFADFSKYSNYEIKKMPFLEAPVYFLLFSYKRGIIDIFVPKRLIYKSFKNLFKFNYRKLMPMVNLKNILLTIKEIYIAKTKQTLKVSNEDLIALFELIKLTNYRYKLTNSKFDELIDKSIRSRIIKKEISIIKEKMVFICNLSLKEGLKELKRLSNKVGLKLIIRIINLHIYFNYILES